MPRKESPGRIPHLSGDFCWFHRRTSAEDPTFTLRWPAVTQALGNTAPSASGRDWPAPPRRGRGARATGAAIGARQSQWNNGTCAGSIGRPRQADATWRRRWPPARS
jgi:hypothetical protein